MFIFDAIKSLIWSIFGHVLVFIYWTYKLGRWSNTMNFEEKRRFCVPKNWIKIGDGGAEPYIIEGKEFIL